MTDYLKGTVMEERENAITFKGKGLTLVGPELKIGQQAPEATVLTNDLAPVTLSSYRGRICVLCTVPSLDTPVCDIEARKFNQEAAKLGQDVQILVVSMDLPFAQKRWCGSAGIKAIATLSGHRQAAFGTAFGVLIKELRLLARAVFVVDRQGIVQYVQVVKELTEEPDYQAVLDAVALGVSG